MYRRHYSEDFWVWLYKPEMLTMVTIALSLHQVGKTLILGRFVKAVTENGC